MSTFDFKSAQKKWAKFWEDSKIYEAEDFSKKPKHYVLIEFPYPSGEGLHMGHCRNSCMLDAYARKKRMEGYNVMYPMGWDAFGLPTYNHAIKVGGEPHEISRKNINKFRSQYKELGISFDWSREVDTTDPKYYKWTQWIFIQMYNSWYDPEFKNGDGSLGKAKHISELPIPKEVKAKGNLAIKEYQDRFRMAFKEKRPVYFCPFCKCATADEEVTGEGLHERCGKEVEQREIDQWLLRITAYADRLIDDLELVDYSTSVKESQKNWIGRKYGVVIKLKVVDASKEIGEVEVFTTRPETNFGATFIVVAPDSKFVKDNQKSFANTEKCKTYIEEALKKTELERQKDGRKKSGEFTGLYAINPFTGEKMPIYIADFVLSHVGTGAVIGVPAHDKRDFEFAKVFNIPVKRVIVGPEGKDGEIKEIADVYTEKRGKVVNSGFLSGLECEEAYRKIISYIEESKIGHRAKFYNLKDWIFSRQHYWGEPTPMIYCKKCGWNPVKIEDLPVELPFLEDYKMGDDGSSPLERAEEWKHTTCHICGGEATRETDVMPNWAGSNWYFVRYVDPQNSEKLAAFNKLEYWLPVDVYEGGAEHVTLHLLYSRFVYKFLYDLGVVPTKEPYAKRTIHGIVLGPDGRKMSKSWGNIVSPDSVVAKYGADVVRTYVMFMGPYDGTMPWSDETLNGVKRFLVRFYNFVERHIEKFNQTEEAAAKDKSSVNKESSECLYDLNILIKKLSLDIDSFKFNTSIAAFMEFLNKYEKTNLSRESIETLLKLISVFAPFMSEELWSMLGYRTSIHTEEWPKFNAEALEQSIVEIPVQINGKVRGKVSINLDITETELEKLLLTKFDQLKEGIKKIRYVRGKIVAVNTCN